jgi:hypothetical protein
MARTSFTIDVAGFTRKLVIYGEPANINYFVQPDLEPDEVLGFSLKTVNVQAHARRQYPGDTSKANIPATTRKILVDLDKSRRSVLPGRNFVLQEDNGQVDAERREFTYTGSFAMLHTYIAANAQRKLVLFNNSGKPYYVPAAGGS